MAWRDLIESPEVKLQTKEIPAKSVGGWRGIVAKKQAGTDPNYQSTSKFPDKREETRAVKELPELGQVFDADGIEPVGVLSGEDKLKIAAIVPALMTTTDPNETAEIIQNNFPNVKLSYDSGGNQLLTNNKTGVSNIINRPGISQRDIMELLGITTAMMPAAKASSLLAPGAKLASKVGAGALAAGATQAGIEGVHELSGGRADASEVALAATLGGVGEAIMPAIQAFKKARASKGLDVAKKELEETIAKLKPGQEALDAIENLTGVKVGLFKAQQTMQPSTLLKQRLLPQLDAGSQQAAKALERQNKEVFEATSELINKIAGPEVVETGTKRFRNAAKLAVDAAKERRKAATKGLYDEAFKVGGDVDLVSTKGLIDDILSEAPKGSDFEKIGYKLKELIAPLREGENPTLKQLQKAKISMQDMIDSVGDKAVSGPIKAEIVQVKRDLVDQMSKASELFRAADDKFMELSPSVKELEDSLVGAASKYKDVNLQNITSRIFSPNSNPFVVRQAKKVIDAVDPGAWDDMLRVEFQRRVGGMKELAEDLPGELTGDVPGQLRRAIFGNPEKRRTLLAALDDEQRRNFVYLEDILRRASAGRQAGSPTEPFKQATEKLRGTAIVLRDMIFRPIESVQKIGEGKLFDRNVSALTEILFDPKWKPNLKQLRNLNPSGTKAESLMREMFDAAKASTQTVGVEDE